MRCHSVAYGTEVIDLIVEADGDLHIALHDATGSKVGIVVCERKNGRIRSIGSPSSNNKLKEYNCLVGTKGPGA